MKLSFGPGPCFDRYKMKLPFVLVFNKVDIQPHDFGREKERVRVFGAIERERVCVFGVISVERERERER